MNRPIHWFDSLDSTMTYATKLAEDGSPSGTVVGADEQRRGQGRYGRSWHSAKNEGLYISEILRLSLPSDAMPVLTLALGLATAEAIFKATDLACDLRWPNDLLAGSKKCAGILVQLQGDAVVAGIGINVNQTEFPEELKQIATSVRMATGREHSREVLLERLLESIDTHCGILMEQGKDAIIRMFSESSTYVWGRRVTVDQGERSLLGVTEGLDHSGFLTLR